jgi:phage terminase large subunit-like protein
MRRYNCYFHVEELTHGNQRKVDRIVWSLQGQMEHGRIVLNTDVDWSEFIDQLLMFPSSQVHDDAPDALAYIGQMTTNVASLDFEEDEWQPMDSIIGY